jgi:pentatricopeptide repeat protein
MKLFREMPSKNICPNVVTYNVLIDGFCKEGKLEEAMKLFYEMPKKTYVPMLSHTMCLLMVSVRKASWRRLGSVLSSSMNTMCLLRAKASCI